MEDLHGEQTIWHDWPCYNSEGGEEGEVTLFLTVCNLPSVTKADKHSLIITSGTNTDLDNGES